MITRIILELGPWSWWVLGLLLLAAELILPGVFLVWIALAALVTGALSLFFWEAPFWSWQVQFVASPCFRSPPSLSGGASSPLPPRATSRCSTGAAKAWSDGRQCSSSRSRKAADASGSTTRPGPSKAPTFRSAHAFASSRAAAAT